MGHITRKYPTTLSSLFPTCSLRTSIDVPKAKFDHIYPYILVYEIPFLNNTDAGNFVTKLTTS